MVHAVHSCGIQEDDGTIVYGGEACGYVLELPGGVRLYHAGDTAVFGDMQIIRELYAPDIALLPIGDHFTMGPREAAHAVMLLQPKTVVPMHFGTFPMLTGQPGELKKLLGPAAPEILEMKPGQTL
jgi:L-ascorbate metabolism protein UlaG (beta-lactamase superfamily)